MARVPSAIRFKKDQVLYVSRVDRTKYLLVELTRAALRDVGKFIVRKSIYELGQKRKELRRGVKRYSPRNSFQYWVRKRENDLIVGIKHKSWYGVLQELGSKNHPKWGILTKTVRENIDEIRRIEGLYLSAIEDENKALGLIDEDATGQEGDTR